MIIIIVIWKLSSKFATHFCKNKPRFMPVLSFVRNILGDCKEASADMIGEMIGYYLL